MKVFRRLSFLSILLVMCLLLTGCTDQQVEDAIDIGVDILFEILTPEDETTSEIEDTNSPNSEPVILDGTMEVHFIDVGQGDSTLIITPSNKKVLIDGGGSEIGTFNVGEKTLLPYLLDRRITTLDYVMISHLDTDHVRTGCYT